MIEIYRVLFSVAVVGAVVFYLGYRTGGRWAHLDTEIHLERAQRIEEGEIRYFNGARRHLGVEPIKYTLGDLEEIKDSLIIEDPPEDPPR